MKIDTDGLQALADLAKLEFAPDELERMRRDLDDILGYVEMLETLDTSEVPPTTHVLGIVAPLRPDRVADVLPVEEAVRNAPQRSDTAVVVPVVKEE